MIEHRKRPTANAGAARLLPATMGLLGVMLAFVFSCNGEPRSYDSSGPLPGESLYHLDATFLDPDGLPHWLVEFRGRPVVFAMIYTRCPQVCPRIVADMQRIQGALPAGAEPHFVAVSIDPEYDRPEQLAAFEARQSLEGDWTLLTGESARVRELAAVLGYQYRQTPDSEYVHTSKVIVLDANGVPRMEHVGLITQVDDFVEQYEELF